MDYCRYKKTFKCFRFSWDDELLDLFEENMNDPNLNPGFDLDAFRDAQLDLHNYYRSLHGAPPMTRNETYVYHSIPYHTSYDTIPYHTIPCHTILYTVLSHILYHMTHCLSSRLTNHAQEFAEILAANDTGLAHCNDKVGCNRFGAGENLAFARGGTSAEINATKAW
jgi:hypothetical protein